MSVCVINFPAHLLWGCNKHGCTNLFFPLQSKCRTGTSTKTVPPFPRVGEPCHRKLKLQRFDITFFFLFLFFSHKVVCSSYLWSSAWDKDSAISAQLTEDFFPKGVYFTNSFRAQVSSSCRYLEHCQIVYTESCETHLKCKHVMLCSVKPLSPGDHRRTEYRKYCYGGFHWFIISKKQKQTSNWFKYFMLLFFFLSIPTDRESEHKPPDSTNGKMNSLNRASFNVFKLIFHGWLTHSN